MRKSEYSSHHTPCDAPEAEQSSHHTPCDAPEAEPAPNPNSVPVPEPPPLRFYNPDDEKAVTHRRLPHWSQNGVITFITWRTDDSMPAPVIRKWLFDRDRWLRANGIDPSKKDWRSNLNNARPDLIAEYHRRFTNRWHDELDRCHGACLLRQRALARIVANALMFFDQDRYNMLNFVVMPNHVHVLVTFPDRSTMLRTCKSWKRFSAGEINKATNGKGRFWQQDAFDHLVRHEEQYQRLLRYVDSNPSDANLGPGQALLKHEYDAIIQQEEATENLIGRHHDPT